MTEPGPDQIGLTAEGPGRMPWRGWRRVIRRVVRRLGVEGLSTAAGGVAFFALMSLFPAIVAAVLIYGIFADPGIVREHLALIRHLIPTSAYKVLEDQITALVTRPATGLGWGLLISLVIAIWSASRGIAALIEIIGMAYRQKDNRSILKSILLSIVFTFLGGVFLLFTVLMVGAVPALLRVMWLPSGTETLVELVRWPILAAAIVAAILCLYRFAPDREEAKWRWIVPGALLASGAWMLFSLGFSLYVDNFASYDATFGSVAAIVVLMLWLYYTIFIIVVGAVLNAELEMQTVEDSTTGPPVPMGERGAYVADHVAGGST
jgi:membrane protein